MSLTSLAQILRERTGLEIGLDRLETLRGQLEGLAAPLGWESFLATLRRQSMESPAVQKVLDLVTVPETFFFRDRAQFEALQTRILPQLIDENRERKQLRILSLGCSTGEEAYSLAIVVAKLLSQASDWRIQITGADICARSLEFARRGVYRRWSFRGVADPVIRRHFLPHPEGYELRPELRELVRFVPVNVTMGIGPYVESLDLILWRNMSIYFAPAVRNRVACDCRTALREGGYFVVGASEIGQLGPTLDLDTMQIGEAWFYRRPARAEKPATSRPYPVPPRTRGKLADPPPAARTKRPPTELERARDLANRGHYEQARAACAQLIESRAEPLEALYLLAQIEQAQGHLEAAENALLQAVKLDRDFVMAHFMVGLGYCRKGHARRAVRHLRRALRLLEKMPASTLVAHSEGRTAEDLRSTIEQALAQIGEEA